MTDQGLLAEAFERGYEDGANGTYDDSGWPNEDLRNEYEQGFWQAQADYGDDSSYTDMDW